jgi:hypothetical protein
VSPLYHLACIEVFAVTTYSGFTSVKGFPFGAEPAAIWNTNAEEKRMTIYRNVTTMKRKAVHLLVASTLLALAVGGTSSPGLAQAEMPEANAYGSAPIEGSWIFAITRTQDPAASFTAVASFTGGGVFLATGSNDRVNPASPLYGSWRRMGRNRFISTTYFFAFDPANPNGPAVAMLKTNQVFQLKNQDELVVVGNLSSCDLQGQNCVNIPAASIQSHGRRIVPENSIELSQTLLPK